MEVRRGSHTSNIICDLFHQIIDELIQFQCFSPISLTTTRKFNVIVNYIAEEILPATLAHTLMLCNTMSHAMSHAMLHRRCAMGYTLERYTYMFSSAP